MKKYKIIICFSADDEALLQKLLPICEALKENNLQTGNLSALLHVLFNLTTELLASTQLEKYVFKQ